MAGLNPQTIGTKMTAGFAGSYARQPDMVVMTRPAGGSANIPFGTPLIYEDGAVVAAGSGTTADKFVGVAGREMKSSLEYLEQTPGEYAPGDPVSVFERGSIQVKAYGDTAPALGGPVYLLISTGSASGLTTAPVPSFATVADSSNTVQLTNCQWGGPADANGIAELVILTRNNA